MKQTLNPLFAVSQDRLETWGANFGAAGALLLALALPQSKWGWVLFMCSNAAWLLFALQLRYRKLAAQTIVFTATSVLGILNSFWPGNPVQAALTALLA